MTGSNHRSAFQAFAREAERELGSSLKKLVLYGSVAKGEATEESDVDIFAVVETREQADLLRDIAYRKGLEHGVAMSPVVKTVDEFREIKDTVYGREVLAGEVYV